MREILDRLRAKLDRLQAADAGREVFGADTHGYALQTAWTEEQAERFEALHGAKLPAEYRAFLTGLGAGGAGPGYGLPAPTPLELESYPRVVTRITMNDGSFIESGTPARPGFARPSSPARAFPLSELFTPSLLHDLPALAADVAPYDGCLRLSDQGCGYFFFLVVTGRYAGQVWSDTMAAMRDGAIEPTGQTFLGWYERWLDDSLAEVVRPS